MWFFENKTRQPIAPTAFIEERERPVRFSSDEREVVRQMGDVNAAIEADFLDIDKTQNL